VMTTESDIFAPCATAKVLDEMTARKITTRLIVGAANDTVAHEAVAERLRERGICYVPDFLANAGGVIQIHAERERWPHADLEAAIQRIGDRTYTTLSETPAGQTPLATAIAQTRRVIDAARARRSLAAAS
jgi:leucine dehydrogenase